MTSFVNGLGCSGIVYDQYPQAIAKQVDNSKCLWVIYRSSKDCRVLGTGYSRTKAWEDAAYKIQERKKK